MISNELDKMLSQIIDWLRLLENSGHDGEHTNCADCERYKALTSACLAMDEARMLIESQTDVTR